MKPQKIRFSKRYEDNSGIEYSVNYEDIDIDVETVALSSNGEHLSFDITEIRWFIDALLEIESIAVVKVISHE